MTKKPTRASLTDLMSGSGSLSRHVAPKGEAVHDAPAKAEARKAPKMRYMQTRLSETGYRALKMLAAEQGRPLQGMVIDGLNDMLRRYGKEAVVTGPERDEKGKED